MDVPFPDDAVKCCHLSAVQGGSLCVHLMIESHYHFWVKPAGHGLRFCRHGVVPVKDELDLLCWV